MLNVAGYFLTKFSDSFVKSGDRAFSWLGQHPWWSGTLDPKSALTGSDEQLEDAAPSPEMAHTGNRDVSALGASALEVESEKRDFLGQGTSVGSFASKDEDKNHCSEGLKHDINPKTF